MALLKRLLFDVPVASWDLIAHLIFAIIVPVVLRVANVWSEVVGPPSPFLTP